MPLRKITKGMSKEQRDKIIRQNIVTEIKAGKPRKQAVAIANEQARKDQREIRSRAARKASKKR